MRATALDVHSAVSMAVSATVTGLDHHAVYRRRKQGRGRDLGEIVRRRRGWCDMSGRKCDGGGGQQSQASETTPRRVGSVRT